MEALNAARLAKLKEVEVRKEKKRLWAADLANRRAPKGQGKSFVSVGECAAIGIRPPADAAPPKRRRLRIPRPVPSLWSIIENLRGSAGLQIPY